MSVILASRRSSWYTTDLWWAYIHQWSGEPLPTTVQSLQIQHDDTWILMNSVSVIKCKWWHLLNPSCSNTHWSPSWKDQNGRRSPLQWLLFKFPLFYQWQMLHIKSSKGREKEKKQQLYFSMIWWGLSNDKRVYSPQSIEHQSVHHSSLSLVDTSSFHLICGGKSPIWLSWDWRATVAVFSAKRHFTQSGHIQKRGFE